MSLLALHLHREWREHRAAVLLVLGVFPALLALAAFLVSAPLLSSALFYQLAMVAAVLAMLVAVGGELIGADRRGRGQAWLERLPRALPAAFHAKAIFLVLTTVLAAAVGYFTAVELGALRGHGSDPRIVESVGLLSLCAVVALWTFATSTWNTRGGMALLAALLCVGVAGLPCWALPAFGYRPRLAEAWLAFSLLAAGALAGAWLSYVPRRLRGAGQARVLAHGLVPLPIVALPLWLLGAARWSERTHIDVHRLDLAASRTVTHDGRRMFAMVYPQPARWDSNEVPMRVLSIDLTDASWEEVGEPDSSVRALVPEGEHEAAAFVVDSPAGRTRAFDARDGAPLEPQSLTWPVKWTRAGLGWTRKTTPGSFEVVDPLRGETFPWRSIDFDYVERVVVLPGRWLVKQGLPPEWCWYDPETKAWERTGWDDFEALLPDGRIVRTDRLPAQRLRAWLFEPATGQETALTVNEEDGGTWHGLACANSSDSRPAVIAPGDAALFLGARSLWRLDPESATLIRVGPMRAGHAIDTAEDGSVLFLDHEALARLDLRTGERRVLFPPPAVP